MVETSDHSQGYLEEEEEMCLCLHQLLKKQPLVQLEKQFVQTWTLKQAGMSQGSISQAHGHDNDLQ